MTPLEHNKFVGWSHLGYALLHMIMTGFSLLFVAAMFSQVQFPTPPNGPPFPGSFMTLVFVFAGIINLALSVPSLVAAYAFLKQKSWAKGIGIGAAVIAAMHFPFGTAAAVYTFWFVFSDAGKSLYDKQGKGLPPMPPNWASVSGAETNARPYETSGSPPDWR